MERERDGNARRERLRVELWHRARRLYALRNLDLTLGGAAARQYRIALPANPDAPLDEFATHRARRAETSAALVPTAARNTGSTLLREAATEARQALAAGEHMPYWGLLWPSGLALADELLAAHDASLMSSAISEHPRPRAPGTGSRPRALELGCGLGVTATTALDAGVALWAVDCFPEAVTFCRYNTLRNTGHMPQTAVLDWRTEAGCAACLALGRFDLLLAADVLYEEPDIVPLLELAPRVLAPGGMFWLAEPGRRVARLFVEAARARGWHESETVYERAWPPDGDVVRVAVHRFTGLAASRQ